MSESAASDNSDKVEIPDLDADLEREIAEALGDQSVEELMAQGEELSDPSALEDAEADAPAANQTSDAESDVGFEVRRGRVANIHGDDVFVNMVGIENKLQGVVPLKQFERPPRQGSIMDFVVVRTDEAEGLIFLSREGAVSITAWDQLVQGMGVEARVVATNKGGLELEMAGGIRAFMPASHVDLHHVGELEPFVGQKLAARVQEINRRSRRVILSRRRHLEHQRELQRQKLLKELEAGQSRDGTVTRIVPFGAFVDLGGIDGLVHISDLSYGRISKPEEIVKVGQSVTIKVLKIDEENQRIQLGLKQAEPDPWNGVTDRYRQGDIVSGRVVHTTNFGVFVELEPGVEGLVPISELSWKRIGNTAQVCKHGDVLRLAILQIDPDKRRISLSLKQATGDPWENVEQNYSKGDLVDATVVRITDFGAFVEVETSVEGLVHISELANTRVKQVQDVVQVGLKRQFRVLDINLEDRKISLSIKAIEQPPSEAESESQTMKKSPAKAKAKMRTKPLKSGLGEHGGMGIGLGNLKL